jgi:hypothetical protein
MIPRRYPTSFGKRELEKGHATDTTCKFWQASRDTKWHLAGSLLHGRVILDSHFLERISQVANTGQQLLHHLAGASQGQQLLLDQVDRHGCNPWAILHRRTHLCGKGGDGDLLALRTLFLLAVMLPHQQTGWRHIHHLSALHHAGRDMPQVRLAVLTAFHRMHHHLIGTRREQQRFAWVTLLTTRLLPALLAQTLGLTAEPIRGGGQVAIVAIFGQPFLQRFHLLSELGHPLLLCTQFPFQQRDLLLLSSDRFLVQAGLLSQQPILLSQLDQFFFCCHALTLQVFARFGKSLGDLSSYELSTIAEIGKERIRRVIAKLKRDNGGNLDLWPRESPEDLGFRVLKLDRSNFKSWQDYQGESIQELETLFNKIEIPLVEGWREADLLTEILLLQGFPLDSAIIPQASFTSNNILLVDSGACAHRLFVCLDEKIADGTISQLRLNSEDVFVCLDSALTDQSKMHLADVCNLNII